MITYSWKLLELLANDNQLIAVRYLLSGTDGTNTVDSEGNHNLYESLKIKIL
jgi:hypothetical protein